MKICKDGRICGQNNKEAGDHLGILTGRNKERIKEKARIRYLKNRDKIIEKARIYHLKNHDKIKERTRIRYLKTYVKKGHNPNSAASKGKKHWNWKGGITTLSEQIHHLPEYEQWRSDVFQRDNWTCQTCGKRGIRLEAHHIKSFKQILKDNHITKIVEAQMCEELWDVNNGVTLCKDCHELTENYGGKKLEEGR